MFELLFFRTIFFRHVKNITKSSFEKIILKFDFYVYIFVNFILNFFRLKQFILNLFLVKNFKFAHKNR